MLISHIDVHLCACECANVEGNFMHAGINRADLDLLLNIDMVGYTRVILIITLTV